MKAEDEEPPGAKLTVPRRDDRVGQMLSRVFQIPATKTIELDEVNAQIWARCDGATSVDQLIQIYLRDVQTQPAAGRSRRRHADEDAGAAAIDRVPRRGVPRSKQRRSTTSHVNRSDRQRAQTKKRRRRH